MASHIERRKFLATFGGAAADQFAANCERGVARLVLDLVANSEVFQGG